MNLKSLEDIEAAIEKTAAAFDSNDPNPPREMFAIVALIVIDIHRIADALEGAYKLQLEAMRPRTAEDNVRVREP